MPFDEREHQLIQDFYYANNLLLDCIRNASTVSEEVKHEIDESLLLPLAEIEKRKREK